MTHTQNNINQRIGDRIRFYRTLKGITQAGLASCIGVSPQQLQKYETGVNRVGASMLKRIADRLATPIGAFFDESVNIESTEGKSYRRLRILAPAFSELTDNQQRAVLHLVKMLAGEHKTDSEIKRSDELMKRK